MKRHGGSVTVAAAGAAVKRHDGFVTVAALALLGVLVAVAALLGLLVSAATARHRAATAADLAALAGAQHVLDDPCAAAASFAHANGARLTACEVLGATVLVRVEVRPPGLLGTLGTAHATARAGPREP